MYSDPSECWIVPSSGSQNTFPNCDAQLKRALSCGSVQRVVATQQKFWPRRRGGGRGLSPHRRVDAALAPWAARCQLLRWQVRRQVRVRQVDWAGQVWEVRKWLGTSFQSSLGGFLTIVVTIILTIVVDRLGSGRASWGSDLSWPVRWCCVLSSPGVNHNESDEDKDVDNRDDAPGVPPEGGSDDDEDKSDDHWAGETQHKHPPGHHRHCHCHDHHYCDHQYHDHHHRDHHHHHRDHHRDHDDDHHPAEEGEFAEAPSLNRRSAMSGMLLKSISWWLWWKCWWRWRWQL